MMESEDDDKGKVVVKSIKILTLGDSGSGKSSLINRFVSGEYHPPNMPTIGVDLSSVKYTYNGVKYKLQIWDTAGQERYKAISYNFFRGAHGIALVFDLTNEDSFVNVRNWVADVKRNLSDSNISFVLIGNKNDLAAAKMITDDDGRELAAELNCDFFSVSAKTGYGVENAFHSLAKRCIAASAVRVDLKVSETDRRIRLNGESRERKKPCHCR